jgi:hypothetical protein
VTALAQKKMEAGRPPFAGGLQFRCALRRVRTSETKVARQFHALLPTPSEQGLSTVRRFVNPCFLSSL